MNKKSLTKTKYMRKIQFFIVSITILFLSSCGSTKKITDTTAQGETRIEIIEPCSEYLQNSKELIRARATSTSTDLQFAKDKAMGLARADMALKIKAGVFAYMDLFRNDYDAKGKQEFQGKAEQKTEQVAKEVLNLVNVVCSKSYTLSSGKYEAWVAIEMSIDNIGKALFESVSKENKLLIDKNAEACSKKMHELSNTFIK